MPGLSCVGIQVRVRIAWPCENRYGCVFPAVCEGSSHWRAAAFGLDSYCTTSVVVPCGSSTVSGAPRMASAEPNEKRSARPLPSVTRCTVRSRVSSTISRALGAASTASVAVPRTRLAAKSAVRSSATSVTRASQGRAYVWMSRSDMGGASPDGIDAGAGVGDADETAPWPLHAASTLATVSHASARGIGIDR